MQASTRAHICCKIHKLKQWYVCASAKCIYGCIQICESIYVNNYTFITAWVIPRSELSGEYRGHFKQLSSSPIGLPS